MTSNPTSSRKSKLRKRIGVVVGQMIQIGGVGIVAMEEVRNFRKLGYDAELIVIKEKKGFLEHKKLASDIPLRFLSRDFPWWAKINFKIPGFSFFSLFHLLAYFAIPKMIKKGDYDLLIVHETYNCFSVLRLQRKGIPCIAYIFDPISHVLPSVYKKKFLRHFFPVILPIAKHFDKKFVRDSSMTFVGSNVHLNFYKSLDVDASKIKVIYPGIVPEPNYPDTKRTYIMALTKWATGKKPGFLIKVLKNLKNKKIRLIVAGNWATPELKREFLEKAKSAGLQNRIEVTGRISNEEKTKLFSYALALIHPIFEGFGMFALEAATCGCPTIMPEKSGVTDVLKNGKEGIFLSEGDVKAFVKHLDDFIDNPKLAIEMGKRAREVANKYTWVYHVKRIEKEIKNII
ncbi:MAG: glycosyltransferase (type 1) [uncultured bacterium]|nr:MAG: glycosyltransferase (type 1) [uncultured bacterium]